MIPFTLLKELIPLAIQAYKAWRKYYNGLTPEQREELLKAAKESFDKAGGMGTGVNE